MELTERQVRKLVLHRLLEGEEKKARLHGWDGPTPRIDTIECPYQDEPPVCTEMSTLHCIECHVHEQFARNNPGDVHGRRSACLREAVVS